MKVSDERIEYITDHIEDTCISSGDVLDLLADRSELLDRIGKLRGALERIASGSPLPGQMPSLEQTPAAFQSAMWVWSQLHARAALRRAAGEAN